MRKALELGPDRGEAHLAAVWVYYHCYFDYNRARSELEIARSTLPNDPEVFALAGYMDRRQGHWKEHIQNLERAAQVDPRNIEILHGLAQGYELLRQFPYMATVLDRILAMIDAALGRKDEALREAQRALELLPADKDPLTHAELIKTLAVVYAWTGNTSAALNELKSLLQIPAPLSYGELRLYPYWDPLRGDPRFDQLVAESAKPVAIK